MARSTTIPSASSGCKFQARISFQIQATESLHNRTQSLPDGIVCPDEMIRTARSEVSQLPGLSTIDEVQRILMIDIASDPSLLEADSTTQMREQIERYFLPVSPCRIQLPTEVFLAAIQLVLFDELVNLIDNGDRVPIAFAPRIAPSEECLPNTIPSQSGSASTARFNIIASSKPGRCHGQPYQLVAKLGIELFHPPLAAGRGRESNALIRMKVVYMRERQKSAEWRIESPPLPFTQTTVFEVPSSGSFISSLELVFPPPKFVMQRSEPNRFER
jgi:hypothetical protein